MAECHDALLGNGFTPLPVGYDKTPGTYAGTIDAGNAQRNAANGKTEYVHQEGFPQFRPLKGWVNITAESYSDPNGPLYVDVQAAVRSPVQGVGVVHGAASSGVVAIDLDTDDDLVRAIVSRHLAKLEGVEVRRMGSKGFVQYVLAADGDAMKTRRIDDAHGSRILEILGTGTQSVLPPSVHPSGRIYEWLSDDTLLDTPAAKLPAIDGDWVAEVCEELRQHFPEAKISIGTGSRSAAARDAETSQALHQADKWVPDLGLYGLQALAGGGFRAVATWRPSSKGRDLRTRKRNLYISNAGISDFGSAEKPRYRPWELVSAALDLDEANARAWLLERVAIDDRETEEDFAEADIVRHLRDTKDQAWLADLKATPDQVGAWERREAGTLKTIMALAGIDRDDAIEWVIERQPNLNYLRSLREMRECTIKIGNVEYIIPAGGRGAIVVKPVATEEPVDAVANDMTAPVDPVAFDFEGANAETLEAAEAARKAVINLADRIVANRGSFRRLSKAWAEARSKGDEAAPDATSKIKIIQEQMATAERNLESAIAALMEAMDEEDAARIAAEPTPPGSEEDHIFTEAQKKSASKRQAVATYREQIEGDRAAIEEEEARIAGERLDRDELRNSPRPLPPIIPVSVYTGLGKTAAWVTEALPRLVAAGVKVLHVADSIELAKEAREKFLEKMGADALVTTLLLGMDSKGEDGKPLCGMAATVLKLKEYGLPTSSLCGFGMSDQCDYASKCPIFEARRAILEDSPSIVFAASANLFVRQQFLDGFEPDVVAIDESFTDFGHGDPIMISLDDLTKLPALDDFEEPDELPEDADEKAKKAREIIISKRRELEMHHEAAVEFSGLLKGLRLRGVDLDSDGSIAAVDLTGMCANVNGKPLLPLAGPDGVARVCGRRLKAIKEERVSVAPNTSAEQMDSLLADADIDLSEINRLRAQVAFAYSVMDAANGEELSRVPGLRLVGEKLRILPEKRVESKWLGYGPNPVESVILLNATPEDAARINYVLSKRVNGRPPNIQPAVTVPHPPMAATVSGRQLKRAPISASRRGDVVRKAEISSSGRQKVRGRVNKSGLAFIMSDFMHGADPAKTVVIGPASVREWLADELPEGVQFLARGKSRGVDRFKGFERLIYVDGFQPPQVARESDSRLLGVVLGVDDYERVDGVWQLKDDALRERVAARKRADIMQGIERLRTRWNTGDEQRFLVLSDVDGILPADEMTVDVWDATDARLSAIEAERQREFLKLANTGVISRHQALMEKVHGRSFTRNELSALWEIAEGFASAPNLHSIGFRQLPADKRRWSGALSYRQDLDTIIEAAFGGAVELRNNGWEADEDRFGAIVEAIIAPNTTSSDAPPIIPLSRRQYEQVVGCTQDAARDAVADLKANPPTGARMISVSFERQRGKPSPWLIPVDMADHTAAERITDLTSRAVKSIAAITDTGT